MNSAFAHEVMSKDVPTLDRSTSLQDTAEHMKKLSVGRVIVTDNNNPVGIITERDFVTKIAAECRPLFTKIKEVMSSPLITIDSEETIWEASELMKEKLIHKLPVKKDGRVIGIITTSDIARNPSVGSDSEMRIICDQVLWRMKKE